MPELNIISNAIQTMSSREVADLVDRPHSNIKISAERLAEKGVIGTLAVQEFTHNGNTYTEYLLNKRDTLILVAQNCPEFTARIVDRWQELEAQVAAPAVPKTLSAALRLAADQADQIEAQQAQLAIAAPKVAALELLTNADNLLCLTDAAKHLEIEPRRLTSWLSAHDWIYKRAGGKHWIAYQPRLKSGLLAHKMTTVNRPDGSEKYVEQVLVTAKGMAKLAELVGVGVA